MDTIRFGLVKSRLEDYMTTSIYINGIDLRQIISSIEYEQLLPLNRTSYTGVYEGISPLLAFSLNDHFCGETINEYLYYDCQYALFDYMYSGIPGDHTLTCKIEFKKDNVRWYDFKNFSKIYRGIIDYSDLSFSFDRSAYKAAVYDLKNNQLNHMYA